MSQPTLFRETIFALSSGALPSGVAVIRLSGPHVRPALERLVGYIPPARLATLRTVRSADGDVLDHGLVLFFEGPASFTGEDCAELQVHGGRATVAAILAELASYSDTRLAEAGEFTRRAFMNGKLDLTTAEAFADLLAAETESQRRLAMANADGGQKQLYESWRRRLLHARAMIEAELDFADESDVPGSVADNVWADMTALREEIVNHVEGYKAAEIVRDGFRVVLVGAPNAGKSSLLNALAKRDVAIVTDIAGTTRDLVEVSLDLHGVKVIVSDTAGLRASTDPVERMGIERALNAVARADLILELIAPNDQLPAYAVPEGVEIIRVFTKADLAGAIAEPGCHMISVITGEGLAEVVQDISHRAAAASRIESVVPSRSRHVSLLHEGSAHINRALLTKSHLELAAEELRLASSALGIIVGATGVEELLSVIFSEFCIGK